MAEENKSQEFRLKKTDETRNYFLEEIEQNEFMSKKHKKPCTTLNYFEHSLNLASTITRCISISAFASLIGIPIEITSSAIGLKIFPITAEIKTYKSIIKNKNKKLCYFNKDKIALLANSKLNEIEALISKALINSVVSHDEFVLINNILKKSNKIKKKKFKYLIRPLDLATQKFIKDFSLFIKQCYCID